MKKYLSFILSASLTLSAIAPATTVAEGTENTTPAFNNMLVLGDSVSAGYGLSENEHSYDEICADYFGCNVDNFAEVGLDSSELRDMLANPTEEQQQAIKNSEVVVLSIGSNDMVHVGAKQILKFASTKNLLNEGYTESDIPEDPGVYAVDTMLNKQAFKNYVNSGIMAQLDVNTELRTYSKNLRLTEGTNAYGENQGIIHNVIMSNIQESVNSIKEINPDAQIIVQTVYQPFQLSPDFVNNNYSDGYASMLTQLRSTLNDVTETFRDELMQIEDIEVIDVLQTFTGLEDISQSTDATPGYAYYFTNTQDNDISNVNEETINIHPNQKGHLAIASLLINKVKVKDTETGEWITPEPAEREVDSETGEVVPTLFDVTFDSIEDIADYPPLSMEQIVETIPDKIVPGDVNQDGKVNAVDATLISMEYTELSTEDGVPTFTEEQNKLGDINYDGKIDARDATYASMYYAYLSTIQPGEEEKNIFGFINQELMDAAK